MKTLITVRASRIVAVIRLLDEICAEAEVDSKALGRFVQESRSKTEPETNEEKDEKI